MKVRAARRRRAYNDKLFYMVKNTIVVVMRLIIEGTRDIYSTFYDKQYNKMVRINYCYEMKLNVE